MTTATDNAFRNMESHPVTQVIDALAPLVAELGYTKRVRGSARGLPLSVCLRNPDPEAAMVCAPSIEVYCNDAYPNERGEVFIHVWNWCGSESPKHVCEHLLRQGIEARVTTHKKSKGVRVKLAVQP